MENIIIKNASIINEGSIEKGDVIIKSGIIDKIITNDERYDGQGKVINAEGLYLMPGAIDDQVHFREPGYTHKGTIKSESAAAAAGGITSFMEMPNTSPQTITNERLTQKFEIAKNQSFVNYSFYLGATNDNFDELAKIDKNNVCGIKIFMGSSTGNMLVDNRSSLENIFTITDVPIAVHCEDEVTIRNNIKKYKERYGESIPFSYHPVIRNSEACYKSSSLAVELASKHGARLHVLHLSTAKELELFSNAIPLSDKKITCEACIHHLWFTDKDYDKHGSMIKWNPAVKTAEDRTALREAVINNKIDVIATDHAPHTLDEKSNPYFSAPSGGPLVQHAVVAMFELYKKGIMSPEHIVDKMCHSPAKLFNIEKRGYIREGYWADLVLVDINSEWRVNKENILYKCNWSPFEGHLFTSKIHTTMVNGKIVYENNILSDHGHGAALKFNRD